MTRLQPWLTLGGIEVVNGIRTLQYLDAALAGPGFSVDKQNAAGAGPGYSNIYGNTYQADLSPAENLACFCSQITKRSGQNNYQRPSYDPAPWYDPANADSADFLGIFPDEIDLHPIAGRDVHQRVPFGASIGPSRPKARVVSVKGTMYAASDAGMAYGERWLATRLNGGGCAAGCAPDELGVLLTCNANGFRTLKKAGGVDGPIYGGISNVRRCLLQTVGFQLITGNPYLLGDPVDAVDATLLTGITTPLSPVAAKLGVRITLFAGTPNPLSAVTIKAYLGDCPPAGVAVASYTVTLAAGHTLIIDSSNRTVTDNGIGGLGALTWSGVFPWIEVCPGQAICVSIDPTLGAVNANTTVSVEQIPMEA